MKHVWMMVLSLLMVCSAVLFAPVSKAQAEQKADELSAFIERHTQTEPVRPAYPEKSDGEILFWDEATGAETAVVPASDAEETARGNIQINKTNFPDDTFRKLLEQSFDKSYITEDQAKAIKTINVTGMGIASLKGIEFFTKLETLYCGASYDDDGNVASANKLTALDTSANTRLQTLYCDSNKLTKLDLSKNTLLDNLVCAYNKLTVLDLTENTRLDTLWCSGNGMKTLTAPKYYTYLYNFDCTDNQLTELSPKLSAKNYYCDNNRLKSLALPKDTIYILSCNNNELESLDLSKIDIYGTLSCMNNRLKTLVLNKMPYFTTLYCMGNELASLDLSDQPSLEEVLAGNNRLTELNLKNTPKLKYLDCSYNLLNALDVHENSALVGLACVGNALVSLDLAENTALEELYCYGQARAAGPLTETGSGWTYDAAQLGIDTARMSAIEGADYTLDNGVFTFDKAPTRFTYLYDTQSLESMDVTLYPPFAGDAEIVFTDADMQYRGETPYMIYDGKVKTPAFAVCDEDGYVLPRTLYAYAFSENDKPGTAYLNVRFAGTDAAASAFFKIFLPASTKLTVENVADGIKLTWAKVDGAAGYVIYRRAWSSTTNGWTDFARWNNTTATTYIDGVDANHKVYAGTRYQYGVKAYFTRRVDPVTGTEIGGNVNDPSGNFNLGIVSQLKTTVRITTRTLESLRSPSSGKLTAKWVGSKLFTGYELRLSTREDFSSGVKTYKITNAKTCDKTITGLRSGTTYYVQVRSYHEFEGMTYYGQWSNTLSKKVQ